MDKNDVIITYCITVCNELEELIKLIAHLQENIDPNDQILVQYDEGGVTKEVKDYLNILSAMHQNHKVVGFPLNNHFADFKNNLKNHADGIFMFQIDADELPHAYMLQHMRSFIEMNKDTDLFFIPRINTVDGVTQKHLDKWNWKVMKIHTQQNEKEMDVESEEYELLKKLDYIIDERNEDGTHFVKYYMPVVQFPDVQTRLYRKTTEIEWEGKVHERIKGYNTLSVFPYEEIYCIYHHKKIDKQEKQNEYYEKL